MTISRARQVDLSTTPYYHLISRCVRRAFLCGTDAYTGRDYSHRKQWMVERLAELGDVFSIDICAYAVMSNHFHLVVRVDAERAEAWSDEEVLERYERLFKSARASLKPLTDEQKAARMALFRDRLSSVSWLMRCFNEFIARRANVEDECTGRFWEGRFKSQALLDIGAVLTCMSYVDLNPVRAGVASSLEDSAFTSIKERLAAAHAEHDALIDGEPEPAGDVAADEPTTPTLMPFAGDASAREDAALETLPMTLVDYAELLDWTGRATRGGKATLSGSPPSLLSRLGIEPGEWLRMMAGSGLRYFGRLGSAAALEQEAERLGVRWVRGQGFARRLYREGASACESVAA